jgi:hypothetical protein
MEFQISFDFTIQKIKFIKPTDKLVSKILIEVYEVVPPIYRYFSLA